MAQRQITLMTDDLDASEATETVHYGLDGQTLEIDLIEKNAARLRQSLEEYVQHARKAGAAGKASASQARARRRSPGQSASPEVDPHAVRAWAESNGYQVSQRGRIAQKIIDAFRAAGN